VSVTWQSHFDWLPSWPWWNPNEILRFVFCLLEMSGKHIRLGIADVDHIDDKYHPLPPPTQNEYRLMEVLCGYGPVLSNNIWSWTYDDLHLCWPWHGPCWCGPVLKWNLCQQGLSNVVDAYVKNGFQMWFIVDISLSKGYNTPPLYPKDKTLHLYSPCCHHKNHSILLLVPVIQDLNHCSTLHL